MAARRSYRKPTALNTALSQLVRNPAPVMTSPPPGSYDPAIDAQVGQSSRGLGDLLSDYVRDYGEPGTALGGRAGEDFTPEREGIERSSGRSLADLLSARSRAGEDHGTAIAGVRRSFAQLGAAQGQTARAAGVQRGGALAQALAKRQGNEAIARQPIDTGFARFNTDSTLAEGRLGEDKGLALADLQRGYLRGVDDAGTGLARAQRENSQFGLDANASRFYQANLPINTPGSTLPKVPTSTTPQATRRRSTQMSPKRLVSTRGWG